MQAGAVEGRSYNSSLDGLQKILKNEGVAGLYKGVGPKLTQSVATVRSLRGGADSQEADAVRATAGRDPFPGEGEDLSRCVTLLTRGIYIR